MKTFKLTAEQQTILLNHLGLEYKRMSKESSNYSNEILNIIDIISRKVK